MLEMVIRDLQQMVKRRVRMAVLARFHLYGQHFGFAGNVDEEVHLADFRFIEVVNRLMSRRAQLALVKLYISRSLAIGAAKRAASFSRSIA